MGVESSLRFTAASPCPVCGGSDGKPRGKGERCYGFRSKDGWAHCTRDEFAGSLEKNSRSGTYAHRTEGPCKCGVPHNGGAASPGGGPGLTRNAKPFRPILSRTRYPLVDEEGTVYHVRTDYKDGGKPSRTSGPRESSTDWTADRRIRFPSTVYRNS